VNRPDVRQKIILLGASGFLGKALFPVLKGTPQTDIYGYSSKEIDLTAANSLHSLIGILDSQSTVVILSAITRDRKDGEEAAEKNRLMIKNIAGYLGESPSIKKCVYLSSSAVYGNVSSDSIDEQTEASPVNHYGKIKIESEILLRGIAKSKKTDLLILRPVAVFGPGDTHTAYGITQFLRSTLMENQVTLYGDGADLRDHLYIKDFALLAAKLVAGDFTGTYNLASGKSYSFLEIAETLRQISGIPFRLRFQPRNIPLVYQRFNTEKLRKAFPSFQFTGIKKSLAETFRSFQKNPLK
jgi:UDP-glucose 4-epimerase